MLLIVSETMELNGLEHVHNCETLPLTTIILYLCQVPHLQIMGLEEKEQRHTMGDQYMLEDISIEDLRTIRLEICLFVCLFVH